MKRKKSFDDLPTSTEPAYRTKTYTPKMITVEFSVQRRIKNTEAAFEKACEEIAEEVAEEIENWAIQDLVTVVPPKKRK